MDAPLSNPLDELRQLSNIISGAIDSIEASLYKRKLYFPCARVPVSAQSEAVRMIPEVSQACATIVAASQQLTLAAQSPVQSIMSVAKQFNLSAALGFASAANVVEACREAGPKGAHVRELCMASDADPSKLSRVLRALATHNIFLEVAPDVFANNCVSSAMDTGKSVAELKDNPEGKHIGTNGIAAAVEHCTDIMMKAAGYLSDVFLNARHAKSQEPTETPFNAAFNTTLTAWEWMSSDANKNRLLRFDMALKKNSKDAVTNTASIIEELNWRDMRNGSLIVDVGGGIGSLSMAIAQAYPHLQFVVQDRGPVISNAIQYWGTENPDALSSGQVRLEEHDFFKEQPIKDVDIFILRSVLHDWSDKYCHLILTRLREAATGSTRLLIIGHLLEYTCTKGTLAHGREADIPAAPYPLLPNGGYSCGNAYLEDLMMMETLNGQERTLEELSALLRRTGWIIVEYYPHELGQATARTVVAAPI